MFTEETIQVDVLDVIYLIVTSEHRCYVDQIQLGVHIWYEVVSIEEANEGNRLLNSGVHRLCSGAPIVIYHME